MVKLINSRGSGWGVLALPSGGFPYFFDHRFWLNIPSIMSLSEQNPVVENHGNPPPWKIGVHES